MEIITINIDELQLAIDTLRDRIDRDTVTLKFEKDSASNRVIFSSIDLSGNVLSVTIYLSDGNSRYSPEITETKKLYKK